MLMFISKCWITNLLLLIRSGYINSLMVHGILEESFLHTSGEMD